ncbi:MAG: lytic transglycosylase domain-containing protein [Solirubrobacterales bacterium]|nr:lytic transglycosylase domain-containing protein [Solirubrobacterales bacterium]
MTRLATPTRPGGVLPDAAEARAAQSRREQAALGELRRARVNQTRANRGRRGGGGAAKYGALLVAGIVLVIVLISVLSPVVKKAWRDISLPLHYSTVIRDQAHQKGLDPALVAGVINAETGFDARTSAAGAEGLMQIEPRTAQLLARQSGATNFRVQDLGTPAVNIAYGCYYLKHLLHDFGGDATAALAAYNGGETNVSSWVAAAHRAGHSFAVADIPFPATRAYVQKVLHYQSEYRSKYASQLGYS